MALCRARAIMKKTASYASSAPGPRLRPKEHSMKKPETSAAPEQKPVRGKYSNLLKQGSNIILLDPNLMDNFPDSPSVKVALRSWVQRVEPTPGGRPLHRFFRYGVQSL